MQINFGLGSVVYQWCHVCEVWESVEDQVLFLELLFAQLAAHLDGETLTLISL